MIFNFRFKKMFFIFGVFNIFLFLGLLVNSISLEVNVSDKYSEVVAGEKFYFELDVKYPENLGRVDLRFEYKIYGVDDKLVAQAKVLKAVETQASFIDSISIPKSLEKGVYVLKVRILDYSELDEEIITSFHVVNLKDDNLQMYFIILIVVVVFVALLVIYDLRMNAKLIKKFK